MTPSDRIEQAFEKAYPTISKGSVSYRMFRAGAVWAIAESAKAVEMLPNRNAHETSMRDWSGWNNAAARAITAIEEGGGTA